MYAMYAVRHAAFGVENLPGLYALVFFEQSESSIWRTTIGSN